MVGEYIRLLSRGWVTRPDIFCDVTVNMLADVGHAVRNQLELRPQSGLKTPVLTPSPASEMLTV